MREKRPTVRDIAKEAGVSIATVSRYLNQDYGAMSQATKLRIQDVVEKSGYVYTKNRSRGSVAALFPNITDPFFAQIVERLVLALDAAGFTLQLHLSQDSMETEKRLVRNLLSSHVDGIIYMSTVTAEENCIEMLRDSGKPFVMMDSYLSEYNAPALVFSDGSAGMYEVTNYLLSKGHQNIAYLSGLRISALEHYRYQGYVNALLDSGYAVVPELTRFIGFTVEDGAQGFCDLLDSGKKFSAVICESDQLAAGVYKVCRQRGLSIPQDMSVVGVNNSFIAPLLEPALTSVDQHVDLQIESAIQLLQTQIRGEICSSRVCKIAPELICRDSVCQR